MLRSAAIRSGVCLVVLCGVRLCQCGAAAVLADEPRVIGGELSPLMGSPNHRRIDVLKGEPGADGPAPGPGTDWVWRWEQQPAVGTRARASF